MTTTAGPWVRSTITALGTGAAAAGSQLPGVAFFTNFAPPSFDPITLITGGLTLAIFVWVFFRLPNEVVSTQIGVAAVIVSVVLAILYSALLNWTTVLAPPETGIAQRFQIGFGLAPLSLTPEGLKLVQSNPEGATPEYLMLAKGAFRPGGAALIWKLWTITVAWLLLSAVFVLTYITWAFGLACVAIKLTGRSESRS